MSTETESNVVEMKDGRKVDFGKRGKQKSAFTVAGEGMDRHVVVTFDIPNGDTHTRTFGFDHPLVMELLGYGVKQKIADSLANAEDPDDISMAVERQLSQLDEGKWSLRSNEASSFRGFADLYQAYLEVKGVKDEDGSLKKRLADADESTLKAIKNNAVVKSILARIAAEKAAARASNLQKQAASGSADDLLI